MVSSPIPAKAFFKWGNLLIMKKESSNTIIAGVYGCLRYCSVLFRKPMAKSKRKKKSNGLWLHNKRSCCYIGRRVCLISPKTCGIYGEITDGEKAIRCNVGVPQFDWDSSVLVHSSQSCHSRGAGFEIASISFLLHD